MPNLGISEFTFSFAFLHEHLNHIWEDVHAIPCLPSLRLEHNLGYDANIIQNGTIFFFQFKTSTYKNRRFSSGNDADEFYRNNQQHTPYFKFYLNPVEDYNQHSRLLALAADFPDTYYLAPCLNNQFEFSQAFFHNQIMNNSRRVQVGNSIPEGDRKHFITYQTLTDEARIWSKKGIPIDMENYSTITEFYNSSISRLGVIDHDYFLKKIPEIQKLGQKYLNPRFKKSFEKKVDSLTSIKKIEQKIEGLAEIMNSYFNINLVLVGRTTK